LITFFKRLFEEQASNYGGGSEGCEAQE